MKRAIILLIATMLAGCNAKQKNPLLGWWGTCEMASNIMAFAFRDDYFILAREQDNALVGVWSQQVKYIEKNGTFILALPSGTNTRIKIITPLKAEFYTDDGRPFIGHKLVPETFYTNGRLRDDPDLLRLFTLSTNVLAMWENRRTVNINQGK